LELASRQAALRTAIVVVLPLREAT
jgi:hypothetical protein